MLGGGGEGIELSHYFKSVVHKEHHTTPHHTSPPAIWAHELKKSYECTHELINMSQTTFMRNISSSYKLSSISPISRVQTDFLIL
jgi:hypothetical protein